MDISIKNLQKYYGKNKALDIDELKIAEGELIGLVGNNGAGKTTFLRLLLDILGPDEGEVLINNEDIHKSNDWKSYTGSFLDEGFLIDFMTPEEYFYFSGELYGLSKADVNEKLKTLKQFMSDEILNQKKYIRQLSTGNKQKTGIIAAMIVEPKLLLLDEPFNFLDPTSQITIRNKLKQINEEKKTTMIISSHNLNHIASICSRIILLEKGFVIKDIDNIAGKAEDIEEYFYQDTLGFHSPQEDGNF